jgi:hypothetical protein
MKLSSTKYQGSCALKKQNPEVVRKFIDLIAEPTETKFLNLMRETFFKLTLKENEKSIISYGEKVFRMLYGNKERIQAQVEGSLTIFDLIKAFKEQREQNKKLELKE